MIAYVMYNKGTASERSVTDLVERIKAEQVDAELLDADSPQGSGMAETYDIMARPAVILIKDDGSPLQVWQGEDGLPSPTDVAYLAHQ